MRILFVTYCFGDSAGHARIGAYKRGLRLALELHERGHEVLFDCTGRTTYHDDQTALAEERFQFLDLRLDNVGADGVEPSRARSVQAIARCRPDLVVIGEAPMVGTMLEATLAAVELGIPVALLDNAYSERAVPLFLRNHGAMMDAVVLTGPSCTHTQAAPPHVRQVPPFVTSASSEAAELVESLGLRPERLVCVLAYDAKVEELGFSLLERLEPPDADFLILSRFPEEAVRRTADLPAELSARVRIVGLLPDPLLFGLIELSRLAVAKCGFLQVTECMVLRTPVICAYHDSATWLESVPRAYLPFVHVAEHDEADPATLAAAARFFDVPEQAMRSIHVGGLDATSSAADFLEGLPGRQRPEAWAETTDVFPEKQVLAALHTAAGGQKVNLLLLRAMRLRSLAGEELHSLVCRYSVNGGERFLRLWGHRYASGRAAKRARQEAVRAGRQVLFASPRRRVLIESDLGQALLPPF